MDRKERRMKERALKKQRKKDNGLTTDGALQEKSKTPSQKKLILAYTLILMGIFSVSLILGQNIWIYPSLWKWVGWGAIGIVFTIGLTLWIKERKKFRADKKWRRFILFILIIGLTLGYTLTSSVETIIEKSIWKEDVAKNNTLVTRYAEWKTGQTYSEWECKENSEEQDAYLNKLWMSKLPPTDKQIDLVVYGEKVLYQSGCDHRFELLLKLGKQGNSFWDQHYPIHASAVKRKLNRFWPTPFEGCELQRQRAISQNIENVVPCTPEEMGKKTDWMPPEILKGY